MGNNLHGGGVLNDDAHLPYHTQLGSYAAIDVTKIEDDEDYEDGVPFEVVKVAYTVGGSGLSRCELEFRRCLGINGKVNMASFTVHDSDGFSRVQINLPIRKAVDTDHLEVLPISIPGRDRDRFPIWIWTNNTNRTVNAWGGITEATVIVYGKGRKGGLFLVEWKKKSGDEKPYMATVAHYYAADDGNFFGHSRMDVGLSVVVRVQASNDVGLKFMAEGPVRHPAAALFYMFDEVRKTGKPTVCPHCANIQKTQHNRISRQQSESEDSDGPPPARLIHTPGQSTRAMVTNSGAVRGNNNGSLIVRRGDVININHTSCDS